MKGTRSLFRLLLLIVALGIGALALMQAPVGPPPVKDAPPLVGQIDRILVEKAARRLTVFQDGKAVRHYRIALGFAPEGDKVRQGDGRTPEGTFQAQVCHARKYLEGTYAARIRFSDVPVQGADGDIVIQSFYAVSPLRFDFDPEFSEVDWEYLPNGGWGDARTRLYTITWQTVRLAPWQAHNQAHQEVRSLAGWHTLVVQVMNGRTRHWIDGVQVAEHGGRNYPVVRMSLNFNMWFSPGGMQPVSFPPRIYEQDVDWVLHVQGTALNPAQVEAQVNRLRTNEVSAMDTIGTSEPELASTCDF